MFRKKCIEISALQEDRQILIWSNGVTGIAALIGSVLLLAASPPAPVPAPSVSPSPVASPHPRFFERGPQFVSAGAAVGPRIRSEFQAGSTSGRADFEGWLASETTIAGRFHVFSFTDYRSFSYNHDARNAVATIGNGGMATVPSFVVHDDQLESGGGIRIAPRIYVGASLLRRQESTGYPPLKGIGYTVMLAPAPNAKLTPYGWLSYGPNIGGIYQLPGGDHTALTYRSVRYRVGVLAAEPHSRLFLDLGLAGENLLNRTNAPAHVSDSTVVIGVGTKF